MAVINGTNGNDVLLGTSGNDIISALDGSDTLDGGAGNDTLDGGAGSDTASFQSSAEGVHARLLDGSATNASGTETDTLISIENLYGSNFNDVLGGDDASNLVNGADGSDALYGQGGDDVLIGGNGADNLNGGDGNDILDGGAGSDTANYIQMGVGQTSGVTVSLYVQGTAQNTGGAGVDTLVGIENVIGSYFDDVIIGNDDANFVDGGNGSDRLFANGGDDYLTGGNGDDLLRGGAGNDRMDGGSGFDRVSYYMQSPTSGVHVDLNIQGTAQDTGGQGMDTLIDIEHVSGTVLDDTLIGNSGDNWLWDGSDADATTIGTGNDVLTGGDGNDLIETGGGNDVLSGGAGIDTWSFLGGKTEVSSAGVTASLALQGAAQDTEQGMITATGFENLSGSIYDDLLSGDAGANVVLGDMGNDTIYGQAGNDTLYGDGRIHIQGEGQIALFEDVTPDTGGTDYLDGGAGNDTLYGGAGSDTAGFLSATEGVHATLLGTNGIGSATNVSGTETDTLISIENLYGSNFSDVLVGSDGANLLNGADGDDYLYGNGGNDSLNGGAGNDTLIGGGGNDYLIGGAGFNTASYNQIAAGQTTGVTVSLLQQGVAQDTVGAGIDTLTGIQNLTGTIYSDTLTGDGGDNWLRGGFNMSTVAGGNDVIDGGAGNDLVEVGVGNHNLTGGLGVDTLSFFNDGKTVAGTLNVSLALQGGPQSTLYGSITASGFENVSGSVSNDTFSGTVGDNVLAGDQGNDILDGGSGNDTLYGDGRIHVGANGITTFADVTSAGAGGNDTLMAGDGADKLYGGKGSDVMTGGAGNDTFVIGAMSGQDKITDFAHHKDLIVFDSTSGVYDFSQLLLVTAGGGTTISWGTGDSIFLQGVSNRGLDAADFAFGTQITAPATGNGHAGAAHGVSSAMHFEADMATDPMATGFGHDMPHSGDWMM